MGVTVREHLCLPTADRLVNHGCITPGFCAFPGLRDIGDHNNGQAGADCERDPARNLTFDAVWTDVRRAGNQDHRAGSPEAKGRVERKNGTHQDRLLKKMRRKKIVTQQAVNEYLEQEYCDDHNRGFALEASSELDYHLLAPGFPRPRPPPPCSTHTLFDAHA